MTDATDLVELEDRVVELWEGRDRLARKGPVRDEAHDVVHGAIDMLDTGAARVAEVDVETDTVVVHQWLKLAILLAFRLRAMETTEVGPFEYVDRMPLKSGFAEAGVRVVPGASARWGSFLGRGVVLMPSYVNIGARVGSGTLVDTWATVGSCAQIGADVHLAGGVGIGGVLEPAEAVPVVVGDGAFVGSRSMITRGARVGDGAVLGAGVILTPSIPVIDAESGEELRRGVVPPWCVAVSASRRREYPGGEFLLPCVLVIKKLAVGERRNSEALNDLLRDHGVAT
jgi:2,3,4,5-tetrahydropyridine-2,6-dicarboxylate N-succinyltransferase